MPSLSVVLILSCSPLKSPGFGGPSFPSYCFGGQFQSRAPSVGYPWDCIRPFPALITLSSLISRAQLFIPQRRGSLLYSRQTLKLWAEPPPGSFPGATNSAPVRPSWLPPGRVVVSSLVLSNPSAHKGVGKLRLGQCLDQCLALAVIIKAVLYWALILPGTVLRAQHG